jgi:hypothetical protein
MDALQQEIERQDRALAEAEAIASTCHPDGRFHIGAEVDERIGALLEQMNVRPAIAPVRGVRV